MINHLLTLISFYVFPQKSVDESSESGHAFFFNFLSLAFLSRLRSLLLTSSVSFTVAFFFVSLVFVFTASSAASAGTSAGALALRFLPTFSSGSSFFFFDSSFFLASFFSCFSFLSSFALSLAAFFFAFVFYFFAFAAALIFFSSSMVETTSTDLTPLANFRSLATKKPSMLWTCG